MANFEVILQNKAKKFYQKCSAEIAQQLNDCFEQLEINPFFGKDVKYLKSKNLYRYRIGGYRVIYDILKQKKQVGVLYIGPRGDIYKKL